MPNMSTAEVSKTIDHEPFGSWFLRLCILFVIVSLGQLVAYKLLVIVLFGTNDHIWTSLFHFPNYFRLLLESAVFLLAIEPFYRASANYWQRVLLLFAFVVFNFNIMTLRLDMVLISITNNYLYYAFVIAVWIIGARVVQDFKSAHQKQSNDADLFNGLFANIPVRTIIRASALYTLVYAFFYWINHDFSFQVLFNQLTYKQPWTVDSIFQQSGWLFIMPVLTLSLASQFVDSKKLVVLGVLCVLWPFATVFSANTVEESYYYFIKIGPLLLGVVAVTVYFNRKVKMAK